MKIVLLDADYNIQHEFEDVRSGKRAIKLQYLILEYRGNLYRYHDLQAGEGEDDPTIYTFVQTEVVELNVALERKSNEN